MGRLMELVCLLYKAVVHPAAVAVTLGAIIMIGLLATQHYALAIPVGLATALLAAVLATSR